LLFTAARLRRYVLWGPTMLTSYWLTPAEILVSENNHSGFYHGELRLLAMLDHNDDDPYCDKLDKLFYFYVTDAEDPILMVYSTVLSGAYIKQGYNRFFAHVIRNRPYWLKAWIVSDRLIDFNVSNDLKIYHEKAVEIFSTAHALSLVTTDDTLRKKTLVADLGQLIKTRRQGFSFAEETKQVLTRARQGKLVFGSQTLTLNGTKTGNPVTVTVKDHGSITAALASLFQQCLED